MKDCLKEIPIANFFDENLWDAGGVHIFMIRQKNIRNIMKYTLYSTVIYQLSQGTGTIKTGDLLQSVQWYYFHYCFSPLDV